MTTIQLVKYYMDLLILQYVQKPGARALVRAGVSPFIMAQTTVQTLTFSAVPTSGYFVLLYGDVQSGVINWNHNAAAIQAILRAIPGLEGLLVTGSIASGLLTLTFAGTPAPASAVTVLVNLLLIGTATVDITVEETDVSLPLEVQNAFNLNGTDTAVGAQLDILGKYAGVVRTGYGPSGPVSLDDADFLTLIQFAILVNTAGTSLSEIQALLDQFFPGQILVFDYKNMRMSYLVDSDVGSVDLIALVVANGLLPKPMAVGLTVIYAPVITRFFGMVSYEVPTAHFSKGLNTYEAYQTDWPWVDYADGIV